MRVIVCGGRDYTDQKKVNEVLDELFLEVMERDPHLTIIEGGSRGADACAKHWAGYGLLAVKHERYPADWDKHSKSAGVIRNQQMLDTGVDLVIAFPGGTGTQDMIDRALKAGVEVRLIR